MVNKGRAAGVIVFIFLFSPRQTPLSTPRCLCMDHNYEFSSQVVLQAEGECVRARVKSVRGKLHKGGLGGVLISASGSSTSWPIPVGLTGALLPLKP